MEDWSQRGLEKSRKREEACGCVAMRNWERYIKYGDLERNSVSWEVKISHHFQ